MGRWKDAFLKSLDPELATEADYEFGPPATAAELTALEKTLRAKLPADLRSLLEEFNGVQRIRDSKDFPREVFYFATTKIPTAAEYYRDWDEDTAKMLKWCRNIAFVCQENGYSEMWGVVVKPFADFEVGQIVGFDHDRLGDAEEAGELFSVTYESLTELVEAKFKDAG